MEDKQQNTEQTETVDDDRLEWQASEYIHHEKDLLWFTVFGVSAVVVMALMYLILQDVLSVAVVALMAVAVVVYANRPPRTVKYSVDNTGVAVDGRRYGFESFKSFSMVQEGAIQSIILNPLQRFMPPITVYYSPEDGDHIVELLSHYLPLKDYEPDMIDRFTQRIRF